MKRWHILQTKPNKERQVAVLIYQRGLQVYLPLLWGDPVNSHSARERPYFPRYLFARFDLQRIEPDIVRWLPGLHALVEFGQEPAVVCDSFVSELRQRLRHISSSDRRRFQDPASAELVQISEGPFAGFEGIFSSSLNGAERARILLACIQREQYRQGPALQLNPPDGRH